MKLKEYVSLFAYNLISLYHDVMWYIILILSLVYWTLYKIIKEYLWTCDHNKYCVILKKKYYIIENKSFFSNIISNNLQRNLDNVSKRYMFKNFRDKISNLKKNDVKNTTDLSKLKSLYFAILKSNNEQTIKNGSQQVTMPIRDFFFRGVRSIKVEKEMPPYYIQKYNKFIIYPEWRDFMVLCTYMELKAFCMYEAENSMKQGLMDYTHYLAYFKRFEGVNHSIQHASTFDIIEESDDYVTVIYHLITTSKEKVDYGGVNVFKVIHLYTDSTTGKVFYTIPLTYVIKLPKDEYNKYFNLNDKDKIWKDNLALRDALILNIKKVLKTNKFELLDLNKDILDIVPKDIDPNYKFIESPYSDKIIDCLSNIYN